MSQRRRLSPVVVAPMATVANGIDVVVVASGVAGAAAIYLLDTPGLWEAVQLEPWVYTAEQSYPLLAVVHLSVLLMVCFGPFRGR